MGERELVLFYNEGVSYLYTSAADRDASGQATSAGRLHPQAISAIESDMT